jgi:hypothetical protein
MGEKGETLRRRNDEAAAGMGPGKTTSDPHRTDGISLTTPVSSPQLVKPTRPSLPVKLTIMPPVRTPLHPNESHRMGQAVVGRDDDDGNKC